MRIACSIGLSLWSSIALAKGGHCGGGHSGGGHGGHAGHGGAVFWHTSSGPWSVPRVVPTPVPPGSPQQSDYDDWITDLRRRAPEHAVRTFRLPSAAESLIVELSHSFDPKKRMLERMDELWKAPEHDATFHGVWLGLEAHPELRVTLAEFVRAHAEPEDADAILDE